MWYGFLDRRAGLVNGFGKLVYEIGLKVNEFGTSMSADASLG